MKRLILIMVFMGSLGVSLSASARSSESIPVIRSTDSVIVVGKPAAQERVNTESEAVSEYSESERRGHVPVETVIQPGHQSMHQSTQQPMHQPARQSALREDASRWANQDLLARASDRQEQSESGTALDQDPLWDLYHQVQLLSEEVRRLRGEVEAAANAAGQLDRRQTKNYVDLDERLSAVEKTLGASSTVVDMNAPEGATVPSVPVPGSGADAVKKVATLPIKSPSSQTPASNALPNKSSPVASAPLSAKLSEKQAYESIYSLLEKRDFEQAKKGFEEFVAAYPKGNLTGNALYWLAELSLRQKKPDEKAALNYIEQFVVNYPKHARIPDALYKKATLIYRRKDVEGAKAVFQRLITEYPNTTASRLADHQLKRLSGAIQ